MDNPRTTPMIVAVCVITSLTMLCSTAIYIMRPGDNSQLISSLIGFATVVITILKSFEAAAASTNVAHSVASAAVTVAESQKNS